MINFLKYRYFCYALSIGLLLTGLVAYFVKDFKYSVDFAGGTSFALSFEKPIKIDQVRAAIAERGWNDAVIQSIGTTNDKFLVQIVGEAGSIGDQFKKEVGESLSEYNMNVDSIEWVGPEVGRDIKWNAFKAIFLSLLLILLYIAIRSKYRFAVGAVAALAHDLLAVMVFILLFGEPISLHVLAAVLAILGYSINDTIVIFSRIRENMKKMKNASEEEIVNVSINQTLRRTILTSVATLLSVLALLLLGGEALHGFSIVMLVGIVFGTYSSIYIASPIMLAIKAKKEDIN